MDEWGGRDAQAVLALVLATYGPTCHLCTERIRLDLPKRHPEGPSTDHLRPRSQGGSDDLHNLRPAHLRCNQIRGTGPLPTAGLPAPVDGLAFFSDAASERDTSASPSPPGHRENRRDDTDEAR